MAYRTSTSAHFVGILVDRLVILLDGIPFIHCNDDTFSSVMGDTGNLGILLGHALCCINQQQLPHQPGPPLSRYG